MTFRRLAIASLAVTLALPALAYAAWAPNGNPLCTATGEQSAPSAASDGSGGMIVAWQDGRRNVTYDIYATRVLGDGTIAPGWPVNGIPVSQSGIGVSPRVVPDGNGGALVLWLQSGGIYMQRVTADGQIASGLPANGVLLPSEPGNFKFDAVTDGAGGAYYGRVAPGSGPVPNWGMILWLARVGPNGALAAGWGTKGIGINGTDLDATLRIAPAPGGDCVYGTITIYDGLYNEFSATAGRVHPNGAHEVRSLPAYLYEGNNPGPKDIFVAPDGAGGMFALKLDGGNTTEPHGHHYDLAGTATWPQNPPVPFVGPLVSDGALGVFSIGINAGKLEANYYSTTGAAAWPPGSVVISQPIAFEPPPRGSPSILRTAPLLGGAFTCWSENLGTSFDIKAAEVSPAGVVTHGTAPGGLPICNAIGDQMYPVFVIDGPGALAAWFDRRAGIPGDIYASRIEFNLPTSVQVSLAAADVTSGTVRLRWSVIDPAGAATVVRSTRSGGWTAIGSPVANSGSLTYEDRDVVPGTEYGYALTFAGDPTARLGEHWVQVPAITAALAGFVPNPSTGAPRIAFALRGGERAQLDVVDLAGRVVMTRDVGSFGPGSHTIDLAGPRLSAGVYVMRLTQGDQVHTARGIIVR